MTKKIIFISGGLHFGDLLAKRMSDSSQYGKSQTLYEVVASGVGRKRYKEVSVYLFLNKIFVLVHFTTGSKRFSL